MKSYISILIIALSIGMYFLYIKPMSIEIRGLNAKKDEYQNVLDRVKEIKDKRDAILLEYNSISSEELERLNKIIPDEVDSALMSNDINFLATQNSLKLKEFKLSENNSDSREEIITDTGSVYKTRVLSMRLSGSYAGFQAFLRDLESSLRLVDISSLSIKSDGVNNDSLDYSLEANTYSLR